jgi:hypothetical protein
MKVTIALAKNKTLTSLNISLNLIEDQGAMASMQNNTLTTLYIGYNHIGDEGAIALAEIRH